MATGSQPASVDPCFPVDSTSGLNRHLANLRHLSHRNLVVFSYNTKLGISFRLKIPPLLRFLHDTTTFIALVIVFCCASLASDIVRVYPLQPYFVVPALSFGWKAPSPTRAVIRRGVC